MPGGARACSLSPERNNDQELMNQVNSLLSLLETSLPRSLRAQRLACLRASHSCCTFTLSLQTQYGSPQWSTSMLFYITDVTRASPGRYTKLGVECSRVAKATR